MVGGGWITKDRDRYQLAARTHRFAARIDGANAKDLHIAWRWTRRVSAFRQRVGAAEVFYTSTSLSRVVAIDEATGKANGCSIAKCMKMVLARQVRLPR